MTFVEEIVSTRIPPRIYNDDRNSTKDMPTDEFLGVLRRKRTFAYFNGEWYDAANYIQGAANEIGNVGSVNNREHSDICRKYADRFIRDALAGKVKPVDISRLSKRKRAAVET